MTTPLFPKGLVADMDANVMLEGYFVLDADLGELIWFGEVERFVGMEQVAMAHQAARTNRSTVVEWYYDGESPLVSACAPVKKQFDGDKGYREDAAIAHTGCCDIRFVQRVKPHKQLMRKIFTHLSSEIQDAEERERAQALFQLGVPVNHNTHGQLSRGFKATFWDNGVVEIDPKAPRYSYLDLVSNADVYDTLPVNSFPGGDAQVSP